MPPESVQIPHSLGGRPTILQGTDHAMQGSVCLRNGEILHFHRYAICIRRGPKKLKRLEECKEKCVCINHTFFRSQMPSFRRSDFEDVVRPLATNLYRRHKTHAHVAFIYDRRKTLLATAVNRVGSRSSGAGFSDCMIHAERAALKRVGDMQKLQGAVLVVIRINPSGDMRGSFPCQECQRHLLKCMNAYGLKAVYYS